MVVHIFGTLQDLDNCLSWLGSFPKFKFFLVHSANEPTSDVSCNT